MNFDQFRDEWLGKRIDFDHVFQFQCVDLCLQYIYECHGIRGAYGNAIDWWTNTDAKLLPKFTKIPNSDAIKGDIVILNGLSGNPYGHIGIATGSLDHASLEILEQNGSTGNGSGTGGDAIRTRYVSRTRVAGLLRPIPAPQPIVHPYTIEQIPEKQVRINKDTHRWGMTYDNFTAMANNPIGGIVPAGDTKTVRAICRHNIGYSYYLEDPNEPSGYNTLDCDDIPAPQPAPVVVPPPTPYIPPLPPNKGTMAETYAVVTPLPYYDNAQIAYNKGKQLGTLQKGTYYVWGKEGSIYNVSTSNMKNEDKWINTQDNVAPVVVPVTTPSIDWKLTRSWFYLDRNKYDLYELQADAVIRDLDGKGKEFLVFANKPNSSDNAMLKVHGTVSKDGTKYYLLHMPEDVNWDNWYVIPMVNPHTRKAYLLKYADLYDTSVKKNQVSPGEEAIAALMSLGYKIFDVLSPRKVREWINKK